MLFRRRGGLFVVFDEEPRGNVFTVVVSTFRARMTAASSESALSLLHRGSIFDGGRIRLASESTQRRLWHFLLCLHIKLI